MRIVVTGASGFLGSNLINRLKENKDYEVCALSSKPGDCTGVRFYHKDVIDGPEAKALLEGSLVVNCAYPRNTTGPVVADGLSYVSRVVNACRENGAKAIINISSQSVYNQKREASAVESDGLSLDTSYAVGKYSTELMTEAACRGSEMAFTNVRMASLIGPGFDQRIVNRFVRKGLNMDAISVNVNQQIFGFLDIADAVSALVAIIGTDCSEWKPVYNTGIGKGYTLKEMIETIACVFAEQGKAFPEVTYNDDDASGNTSVDYRLLQADTGWAPEMSLKASVEAILAQMEA